MRLMAEQERLFTFLNSHQDEIINWISSNVITQFKDKGDMFDRTANMVNQEYPYGKTIDNMHRFLTNPILIGFHKLGQMLMMLNLVPNMSISSVVSLTRLLISE